MHAVMFMTVCLLWGHSFLLMKYAEPVFGACGVGAVRQWMGAATLAMIWLAQGRARSLRRGDLPAVAVMAAIGYALPFAMQPYVIGRVEESAGHGGAFGGMMVGFVPLITILVSIPMLRQYPARRQILGVIGGLGCLALLFGAELNLGVPIGLLLLGALSPLGYAISNTLVKSRFAHVAPMQLTMTAMCFGAVYLTPPAVLDAPDLRSDSIWLGLAAVGVLGVVCTGLAMAIFYRLIQHRGPLYAGMVTYVVPCLALIVGWFDGETIKPQQVLAMVGVLAMVALVQSDRPHSPSPN